MNYQVIKAINNNVVLATDTTGDQVVLMSKGIGFGRRPGDRVSDANSQNQIFKLWTPETEIRSVEYDRSVLEHTVEEIAAMAQERMGIEKEKLAKPLLDHILFSIDRINFGLPEEDPFLEDTYVLYAGEYQLAKEAVELLEQRLGLHLGRAELGYIALHLNAVRRSRPIGTSMEHVRMYNDVLELLYQEYGRKREHDYRTFLMELAGMLQMQQEGISLTLPRQQYLVASLPHSHTVVQQIAQLVRRETRQELQDGTMVYLTLELEKLRQASGRDC